MAMSAACAGVLVTWLEPSVCSEFNMHMQCASGVV